MVVMPEPEILLAVPLAFEPPPPPMVTVMAEPTVADAKVSADEFAPDVPCELR
jgi:hypothetical protein